MKSLFFLKFAVLVVVCNVVAIGTDPGTFWEEKLETEIDLRPPSSFRHNHSGVIMNVRQLGFLNMPYNHSGVISTRGIGGWDQFANRSGTGIWSDRQYAIDMCQKQPKHCFFPRENYSRDNGLPHKDFVQVMTKYPFIACVHGSGIEPSPKAWEAILIGCIPILQRSTLDDAYERLPVVFVTEWSEVFENPDIEGLLKTWLAKLAPYYEEGSELRARVLERLNMDYWLEQIRHKYRRYFDADMARLHHGLRNASSPASGIAPGNGHVSGIN